MYELYVFPKDSSELVEYFCFSCGQLRLSCNGVRTNCGNCGSKDIKHGKVGSLDKEALKRQSGKF